MMIFLFSNYKTRGGVLERTEIDPFDGILTSVYSFDVNETVHKYEETFKNNICISNYIRK